eukprot:Skav234466  [mRNA]  locus=scaffold1647:256411:259410:+ [translate_table: standard]
MVPHKVIKADGIDAMPGSLFAKPRKRLHQYVLYSDPAAKSVFDPSCEIHAHYDLKGSLHHRKKKDNQNRMPNNIEQQAARETNRGRERVAKRERCGEIARLPATCAMSAFQNKVPQRGVLPMAVPWFPMGFGILWTPDGVLSDPHPYLRSLAQEGESCGKDEDWIKAKLRVTVPEQRRREILEAPATAAAGDAPVTGAMRPWRWLASTTQKEPRAQPASTLALPRRVERRSTFWVMGPTPAALTRQTMPRARFLRSSIFSPSEPDMGTAGMLKVEVISAKNLRNADIIGASDPYVVVRVGLQSAETNVIEAGWNGLRDYKDNIQEPNALYD